LAYIKPVYRIVLGALALFLVYTLFLTFAKPQVYRSQHHWQENVITAQRYMYSSSSHPGVGGWSSISTRLLELPPYYYNLAFGSASAVTGLTIVLRKAPHPQLVPIETNVLGEVDHGFVAKLYNPVLYPLKRHVLSLREEYNPLNVLMSLWLGKPGEAPVAGGTTSQSQVPREVMQFAIDKANAPINDAFRGAIGRQVDLLERVVQSLVAANGVPVFFFMPMHPEVSAAPMNQYQRRVLQERFPTTHYHWLSDPSADRFQTSDGIHLTRPTALEYCRHFVDEVESIRKRISSSPAESVTAPTR